jgi:hypothetical protein
MFHGEQVDNSMVDQKRVQANRKAARTRKRMTAARRLPPVCERCGHRTPWPCKTEATVAMCHLRFQPLPDDTGSETGAATGETP